MQKLSREQAAVIGAYTGYLAGPFSDLHEYAEKAMGRPVWTHEFGHVDFEKRLQDAAREDFILIAAEKETADAPS